MDVLEFNVHVIVRLTNNGVPKLPDFAISGTQQEESAAISQ